MLELFQIRDLHRSPSPEIQEGSGDAHDVSDQTSPLHVETSTRRGIIQISGPDYDKIATNHPRAQLSYIDDDDGELIMVGSSLELSQRLEDPIPLDSFSVPDFSGAVSTSYPMHIFDIRRSKSVIDLWKKYEHTPQEPVDPNANDTHQTPRAANLSSTNVADQYSPNDHNVEHHTSSAAATTVVEPLLAAFEAQMADILRASEALDRANDQSNAPDQSATPHAAESQATPSEDRYQGRNETFATAMHNLIDGADRIRSGVMARLPELERQLQNAQRALPEPVGSSVQVALTALEDQARSLARALHNATGATGQNTGPFLPPELPEGLRNIASDIGHMGQSLFDAFESEFGCAPRNQTQTQTPSADGSVSSPPQHTESQVPDGTQPDGIVQQDSAQRGDLNASPQRRCGVNGPKSHERPSSESTCDASAPTSSRDVDHLPWSTLPPQLGGRPKLPPCVRSAPQQHRSQIEDTGINTRRTCIPPQSNYSPPRPHSATLFIGNVGFNVNEKMIFDVFASKGFLVDVHLPTFPETASHAGFGYIFFHAVSEAKAALEALQGFHIDGHSINLELSDVPPLSEHSGPRLPPLDDDGDQDFNIGPRSASLSVAELCSTDIQHPEHRLPALENSALLDSQRLDALYPSLLPESAPSPRSCAYPVHEHISDQERRFPPVSQLDAHFLAERARLNTADTHAECHGTGDYDLGSRSRNLPGSFPQDAPEDFNARPWSFSAPYRPRHPSGAAFESPQLSPAPNGRSLRHSRNVPFPCYWRRYGAPAMGDSVDAPDPPIKPVPSRPQVQQTPASRRDLPENPDFRQQRIDECISILADLGYGSTAEGGLQRIGVYAAAADGKVSEAIEMIEEERKVYEQQIPMM